MSKIRWNIRFRIKLFKQNICPHFVWKYKGKMLRTCCWCEQNQILISLTGEPIKYQIANGELEQHRLIMITKNRERIRYESDETFKSRMELSTWNKELKSALELAYNKLIELVGDLSYVADDLRIIKKALRKKEGYPHD